MPGQLKRRISAQTALLFLATGLQADITLPVQAPPQADAQAVRVWRGGHTTIPLRGHHGGGGTVTFWIVQRPEHGKLSQLHLTGDNRAAIAYENDGLGHDEFMAGKFDAGEFSLAMYLALKSRGAPYMAIPVFPNRKFRQSYIFVPAGSPLTEDGLSSASTGWPRR